MEIGWLTSALELKHRLFLTAVCGGWESLLEVDVLGGPMLLQVGKGYNLFTIQWWLLNRLLSAPSIIFAFLLLSHPRGISPI